MNTAYFYLTPAGKALAEKLAASHPGDLYGKENFKDKLRKAFGSYDQLVCIMATGIVVRILAPVIVHKTSDPAVVVLDQKGEYAISLLSGHLGGANDLAREMAFLSGGEPVITTATDVAGQAAFDTFARIHNMSIENIEELKHVSGSLLEGRKVRVYSNRNYSELKGNDLIDVVPVPEGDLFPAESEEDIAMPAQPSVVIDEGFSFKTKTAAPVLYLRPRTVCAGIGCKKNMDQEAIEKALRATLAQEGLSPLSLRCLCTIPLKAGEPGIIETARRLSVPLEIIPTEKIQKLDIASMGIRTSDFVRSYTGVLSVSTASAYLASGCGEILRDKAVYKGITIALAREL